MSAALITASILSLVGLVVSFALGYLVAVPDDVLAHATLAIFVTLITLLGHSMTMFYLIGKVKAIKDAVIEGGLETDAVARVSALRGPVFKLASMAIGLTMLTAILGGGVDTGVIPSGVHALLAIMAVVANFLALRAIVEALSASGKIVDEVNRDLGV
jgi:hypothetical protein|tara:strand:+ start:48 stop:521 length:474 start_codon:yes stop_codon:yes gene_type:complete